MARQRFDTAPEFNVDQDSVVIRQAAGSATSILEVLDESATPVFTIHNSGEISMPSVLSVGGVSSSEMSHLSGVSSNIQTQLDTKAPSVAPTFTGSVTLPATTSIGPVSAVEIGYIDGVTSAIQTQINAKAPLASPTFTGTVTLPSDTSIGNVSSTEIGYVDGVTSSIQTQINAKAPIASPTFTGTVTIPILSVTSTSSMSDTLSFPWSGTNINATGTVKGNGAVVQFVKTDHGPYDLTSNAYVASVTMSPKYSTSTMYVWVNYHAYKYNSTEGVNNAYQLHHVGGGNIRQNSYLVYSSPQYMFQGVVSGTIAAGSTSSRTYAFYVNASSSADRIYFYWLSFYVMEIAV